MTQAPNSKTEDRKLNNPDNPVRAKVLAQLIMNKRDGNVIIVQVLDISDFHDFYFWSHQAGIVSRTSNRNNDSRWGGAMDIEQIPADIDKHAYRPELMISSWKVEYPDKERYLEMLQCPPDQLGHGLPKDVSPFIGGHLNRNIPVKIRYEDSSMYRRLERVFK